MSQRVYLIGANPRDSASLCEAVRSDLLHLEPLASVAKLRPQVVAKAAAFLAWDQGELIPQLKVHLSILAHRAPIIAIAEQPSIGQIVRAVTEGAVDYLSWPCSPEAILEAVSSAMETAEVLPRLKQRAIKAHDLLARLPRRERAILKAMAQGMQDQAIGELLEIEPRTVEIERRNLVASLGVVHSAEAIRLELEASMTPERTRQSAWTAPWLIYKTIPDND